VSAQNCAAPICADTNRRARDLCQRSAGNHPSALTQIAAGDTVGGVSESAIDPEIGEVLAANQAFYDAHEERDIDAMRAVWEHSDRVVCTHPGWPMLRTWALVEDSWRRILGGPGRNQFILTNEAVTIQGDVAVVTLDENLVDAGGTGTVAATNVYARSADGWRLVVHHGSPVMTR
jgi:ketosteroid isomerase-like protein